MKTLIIGKNSFIGLKFKELNNSKIISHKSLKKIDLSNFDKVLLLSMPKYYNSKISKITFEKKIFKLFRGKRMIYFSTSHVYPNKINNLEKLVKPQNIYAQNKIKIENEIKNFFEDYLIIRAPIVFKKNHYSKNSFFDILNNNFKKNKIYFDINQNSLRDLITLDDLFNLYLKMEKKNLRGIYNIGSGKGISIKKIISYYFGYKLQNPKLSFFFNEKKCNLTLNVQKLENKINKFSKTIRRNVLRELKL
tara:strand:+ start:42 stop:788 length:747 start_codon:yes stop_codon:yes gene_type:complete